MVRALHNSPALAQVDAVLAGNGTHVCASVADIKAVAAALAAQADAAAQALLEVSRHQESVCHVTGAFWCRN